MHLRESAEFLKTDSDTLKGESLSNDLSMAHRYTAARQAHHVR